MHLDHPTADHWEIFGHESEVGEERPLVRAVGPLVLLAYRSAGTLVVAKDDCPHQGASFAGSRVIDGCLVCPFHGWTFDREGCYIQGFLGKLPEPVRQTLRLERYPVLRRAGRIWVLPTPVHRVAIPDLPRVLFAWHEATNHWRPAQTAPINGATAAVADVRQFR